jgi:hypothetical protein
MRSDRQGLFHGFFRDAHAASDRALSGDLTEDELNADMRAG